MLKKVGLVSIFIIQFLGHVSATVYEATACCAHAAKVLKYTPVLHTFFTPFARNGNYAKKVLLGLIHSEKTKIRIAAFRLTDKDVALALQDAFARNVDVELVVDSGGTRDKYSQVSLLSSAGVPVFPYKKYYSIMHNKYVVLENCLDGKRLVWTGSANFTHSGLLRNAENVIVVEDDRIVNEYLKDFERIKHEIMYKHDDNADAEA